MLHSGENKPDDNISTPTSMILPCLITLVTPSLWPAFAAYVPTQQPLTNFSVHQLVGRQEACVKSMWSVWPALLRLGPSLLYRLQWQWTVQPDLGTICRAEHVGNDLN
jgi:hypothetical protein